MINLRLRVPSKCVINYSLVPTNQSIYNLVELSSHVIVASREIINDVNSQRIYSYP